MNEKINLYELLKDCPSGTIFWCDVVGEVIFKEIKVDNDTLQTTIVLIDRNNKTVHLEEWGNLNSQFPECCVLWPSKNIRSWNGWKLSQNSSSKFNPINLKPFDKVLVRGDIDEKWYADFVCMPPDKFDNIPYTMSDEGCNMIIPYNDITKHLIGTTENAPFYYRYWEE